MCEQVTVHYVDFGGNTYYYTMPEDTRCRCCKQVDASYFDDDAFTEWYQNWSPNTELAPYDGGRINLRAVARMWYTVEEVH